MGRHTRNWGDRSKGERMTRVGCATIPCALFGIGKGSYKIFAS